MAPRPPLERLKARPSASLWADGELVSLSEAAALFFPNGPLTSNALRIAVRRGELAAVEVCGKLFTTPGDVRAMRTPRLVVADECRSDIAAAPDAWKRYVPRRWG